jgi:hypothetical protein
MAEWLGHFLGQFPAWIALPAAFIICTLCWIVWTTLTIPGDSPIEQWIDRRRRERKLSNGKK